jgi:hypothetical protein
MCSLAHLQKCERLCWRIRQTDIESPIMAWSDAHYKRRLAMSDRARALLERARDATFDKYLKAKNQDQEVVLWFI